MINVGTLIRFLLFDANAIRKIAASRSATWIGMVFVFSAGFAREYDGEFLVAQPWHLLIPVAASVFACFFMVLLIRLQARHNGVGDVSLIRQFRCFLNLFWMTAPLAWIYAIPVERFCTAAEATSFNMWLLAIVAFWRVSLMIRCVQVVYSAKLASSAIPVLFFCDILAMTAMAVIPAPVFMVMGGVRLSESEQLILSIRLWLTLICYGTFLLWFIGYLVLLFKKENWTFLNERTSPATSSATLSIGIKIVAGLSILCWGIFLPFTQHEQFLRWKSENLIRQNRFQEFAQLTNEHPRSAFPNHWDLPPRIGYGQRLPYPEAVVGKLWQHDAAPWVVDHYLDKLDSRNRFRMPKFILYELSYDELAALLDFLSNHPEARKQHAKSYAETLAGMISADDGSLSKTKRQLALEFNSEFDQTDMD